MVHFPFFAQIFEILLHIMCDRFWICLFSLILLIGLIAKQGDANILLPVFEPLRTDNMIHLILLFRHEVKFEIFKFFFHICFLLLRRRIRFWIHFHSLPCLTVVIFVVCYLSFQCGNKILKSGLDLLVCPRIKTPIVNIFDVYVHCNMFQKWFVI